MSGRRRVTVGGRMSWRRPRRDAVDGQETAELAALADGSLPPERREELAARVASWSELADRLAEQQRAVAMAHSAAAEVEAPAALKARIEAQRRPPHGGGPPRLPAAG